MPMQRLKEILLLLHERQQIDISCNPEDLDGVVDDIVASFADDTGVII